MKTMTVGQFKAEFSDVLARVAKGQAVAVAYGRKHKPVAMMVPYEGESKARKLGLLEGRASYRWINNSRITDEELLSS